MSIELISDKATHNIKRHIEKLAETCNSVIEHFGCNVDLDGDQNYI